MKKASSYQNRRGGMGPVRSRRFVWCWLIVAIAATLGTGLTARAEGAVVYSNNFESAPVGGCPNILGGCPGGEWTTTFPGGISTDQTPRGHKFIGAADGSSSLGFDGGCRLCGGTGTTTATLTLTGLAPHTTVTVNLDLYIIGSWDGTFANGPDKWTVTVDGVGTLLGTTFAAEVDGAEQCYPSNCPASNPPHTGSAGTGTLGYTFGGGVVTDDVYHLSFTFAHTDPTLRVNFTASTDADLIDESWGVDNVVVQTDASNQPPVANAGPDQTVLPGALVTLNGQGSSGSNLTYTWVQNPSTVPVSLSDPHSPMPTFTTPDIGQPYQVTFHLTVSDGTATSSDDVTISVHAMPPKLTNLAAEVGSGLVKLHWDPPLQAIDSVRIAIDRLQGTSFVTFGTQVLMGSPGINPTNAMLIFASEAGDALQNGTFYRFTVSAKMGDTQGEPSDPVYATPGFFAFTAPAHPDNPILFLPGFWGDENSFSDTATFMHTTLGWSEGELLTLARATSQIPLPVADFYRGHFSHNTGSLAEQGYEVCQFIRSLSPRKVSILAHSNGGLAARACFAQDSEVATLVRQFITYGTPHRGADVYSLAADLIAVGIQLPFLPVGISAPGLLFALNFSQGATDAKGCNLVGNPQLSEFLTPLSTNQLPPTDAGGTPRYVAIIGHHSSLPRLSNCLGADWDGLVPAASANLQQSGVTGQSPVELIHRPRFHMGQGDDFSAYLCALKESHCVNVTVGSPVDIQIVAPDGRMLSRQVTELPGASFVETVDETGHPIDSALIPFPIPGTYEIHVTPKPGAAPTDTFTITLTQNGVTTVIAQDMKIQDIPPSGFAVPLDPVPPTTTATAIPAANGSGWNNTTVTVNLVAIDNAGGAGVKDIRYALTGSQGGSGVVSGSSATLQITTEGVTMISYFATDNAGNQETPKTLTVRIDKTPPSLTVPANQTVQQTSPAGAIGTYPDPTIVETGSGIASSSCLPASGSVFATGSTTVTCTATDRADNTGSGTFTITVTANSAQDGRMYGVGHIDKDHKHYHFVFRVSQLRGQDYGRLEYWVNDLQRCPEADDDYDHDRNRNGDHDRDYGWNHRNPPSRFETTSMKDVTFSDDPAFRPDRRANGRGPTVDTVRFSGTGRWNGRAGYTFEAIATDQGEPGRHRDTFSLVVRDSRGAIVANVSGDLDGGNIQSTRLDR